MDEPNSQVIVEKTSEIVAAFVSNNETTSAELPALIQAVHRALSGVTVAAPEPEPRKEPAVSVRRSVTPDYLICLEDGRRFKSLKRHLRTKYDMSPEEYRSKWALPKDYPMVAPNYAAARSALAKNMGLGKGGRQPPKSAARGKRTAKSSS